MEATLHRDCYLESTFFDREREHIFFHEWFCVGRESELAEPGDYQAHNIAGQSILVVRDTDDTLRGFFNLCRHRGSQLIAHDSDATVCGHKRANIRCPYHSWTYRFDGSLHHTPHLDVDKAQYSLHSVQVACWGGFVFVRVDASDNALAEQLGAIPQRVARYPLHDLQVGQQIEYSVAANWKAILENYNECYHCAGVHPELCKIVPVFRQGGGAGLDWGRGIPQREGTNTFTLSGHTERHAFPGLNVDEQTRHFGELAYPNLMLSLAMDHAAAFVLRPRGPERTDISCYLLFHPDEIRKSGFDPSDAGDFWDIVNKQDWQICENVQRGMHARPFVNGYYADMEDLSLDIRNYVATRLGIAAERLQTKP